MQYWITTCQLICKDRNFQTALSKSDVPGSWYDGIEGLWCLSAHRGTLGMQAFFADIYAEAAKAAPGSGHWAISGMAGAGQLRRHYTMNIDGLSEAAGLSTWHPTMQPHGRAPILKRQTCSS